MWPFNRSSLPLAPETRPRYMIVIHTWFVSTRGFHQVRAKSRDKEGAEAEAKQLCFDLMSGGTQCAFTLVQLD